MYDEIISYYQALRDGEPIWVEMINREIKRADHVVYVYTLDPLHADIKARGLQTCHNFSGFGIQKSDHGDFYNLVEDNLDYDPGEDYGICDDPTTLVWSLRITGERDWIKHEIGSDFTELVGYLDDHRALVIVLAH